MIVAAPEIVVLGSIFGFVMAVTTLFVSRSSREWAATWRGQRIHIVMTWNKCQVMVDNSLVGESRGLVSV